MKKNLVADVKTLGLGMKKNPVAEENTLESGITDSAESMEVRNYMEVEVSLFEVPEEDHKLKVEKQGEPCCHASVRICRSGLSSQF